MKPDKNKKGGPPKPSASQQGSQSAQNPSRVFDSSRDSATKSQTNEQTEPTKTYSRRKIVSNWDKYEEQTTSITYNEAYEPEGDDFNKLLQMPSSADSHFKFKSEQLEPLPCGNLFALNLKSLATGLATIPFHQLVDIPSDTFSRSEVANMDKKAVEQKEMLVASSS